VLQDRTVAGHERRRGEANDLPEREIPRHHREDEAERLERDETLSRVRLRRLVREEALRVLGVKVAVPRALLELGQRLADRLAHLEGDEACILVGALAQHRRQRAHRYGALVEGALAPGLEGRLRFRDRGVHLLAAMRLERRKDRFGRRIDRSDLHCLFSIPCPATNAHPRTGRSRRRAESPPQCASARLTDPFKGVV